DPARLNPVLPVDVSVDHSLAVEAYARPDAAQQNIGHEIRRNRERYRFLRWASQALQRVRISPPGTGIMHTINLEQLATVVRVEPSDGQAWAVPDMMIGTDSHTPMINGIGVLGWGVGGLEAQTVMFGMPTMLRIPDVIGLRLTNALRPGVLATYLALTVTPALLAIGISGEFLQFHCSGVDMFGMPTMLRIPDVIGVRLMNALRPGVLATELALTVTQRLRAIGVSGEFVEFHGPGVATLTAGERAVVANMAPEYGATTGYFP